MGEGSAGPANPQEPGRPGAEDEPALSALVSALEAAASRNDDPTAALLADVALAGRVGAGSGTGGRNPIEKYKIIDEIGRGGFGTVHRAYNSELDCEVALKVPSQDRALTSEIQERFRREARAIKGLDHPNIVRLLEVGDEGGSEFFLALAYCEGPNLEQWLKDNRYSLSPRQAARLASDVADALAHAHGRDVLHRDVKPSNILLQPSPPGEEGPGGLPFAPMLTDFGLARIDSESVQLTQSHALIGTLPYIPPEHIRDGDLSPAPTADIYSLGVTLYEILTGRLPFRGDTPEILCARIAAGELVPPRTIRPAIPRDLETICLRCLERDPARRYPSAAMLRDHLLRFLDGRRVPRLRHGWSLRRRLPGMSRRAFFGIAAAAPIAALAWKLADVHRRSIEPRRLLEWNDAISNIPLAARALESNQIEEAQDILDGMQPTSFGDDPRGFAWSLLRRKARRDFSQIRGARQAVERVALSRDGRVLAGTVDLEHAILFWDFPGGAPRPRAVHPRLNSSELAISGNGRWAAANSVLDPDGRGPQGVLLWDSESGRWAGDWPFEGERFDSFGFLAGDRVFAALCHPAPGHDEEGGTIRAGGKLRLWDLTARDETTGGPRPIAVLEGIRHAAWGTNRLFAMRDDRRLEEIDPATGTPMAIFTGFPTEASAFCISQDDRVLASLDPARGLLAFDATTRGLLGRLEYGRPAFNLHISPRGGLIVAVGLNGIATAWDWAGERAPTLALDDLGGMGQRVAWAAVAFSEDETQLATGGMRVSTTHTPVRLWDAATGGILATLPGQRGPIRTLHFAPDGRSLLIGGRPTVIDWKVDGPEEDPQPAGHAAEAWRLAFSPDSRVLASASDDVMEPKTIRTWDAATGKPIRGWKGHAATVTGLAFCPDGHSLVTATIQSNGDTALWDPEDGRLLATCDDNTGGARTLACSPDGKSIALGTTDGKVRIWCPEGGECTRPFADSLLRVRDLAFSPEGDLLAAASEDGFVRVWDFATGRLVASANLAAKATTLAFALGGRALAAGDNKGVITILDPTSGEAIRRLRGESQELLALAIHPDGKTLAAAGMRSTIRLLDVESGLELLELDGHEGQINDLAFSPDGKVMASCDHKGKIKLWRTEPPGR